MDRFHRQRDLLTPADLDHLDVDLVGAGSLGGAVLLCLGKMGFGVRTRMTVTDFDRCEEHNLPTQWFRASDVTMGRAKVEALADTAAWVLDREIESVAERFTGAEARRLGTIVVLAVDTLEERRRIWTNLARREDVRFLVDVRAGAEVVEVFALVLRADDRAPYEESLAGEPFREPCTRRSIAYTALGAAALVGSVIRSWVRGHAFPRHLVFDFRNFWVERAGDPSGTAAV
jgi:molybdopterin/thiamine biosynthesis adenylyltransferase